MLQVIFRGHDEAGFFAHALSMNPGGNPLAVLPGNRRAAGSRYACLIVVKDYHRLRTPAGPGGEWHYSAVEPEILGDVRAGRAILIFDLSNEGPAYDCGIFDELYAWIERNRLPAKRVIWLAQNRLIESAARAQAAARAELVEFDCYDYFVKVMAWNFSPWAAPVMAGPPHPRAPAPSPAVKDRLLLCLNATPRLSRILAVAALHHHGLMSSSLVSFPGMSYVKPGASISEVMSFLDANPRLGYLRSSVAYVASMPPLAVDRFTEQGNALVEKMDYAVYERSFLSLVTESDFAQPGIARVTEKSVKAFCMGHPTIILGNPHSIDILRGYGFRDWSGIFDRDAESISSPALRFDRVVDEVLRQTARIRLDPASWLAGAREVSAYNHRHARSGDFLRRQIITSDQRLVHKFETLLAAEVVQCR